MRLTKRTLDATSLAGSRAGTCTGKERTMAVVQGDETGLRHGAIGSPPAVQAATPAQAAS